MLSDLDIHLIERAAGLEVRLDVGDRFDVAAAGDGPFSAVTISRVVRAWLAGGPISVSAATTTAAPTSTSSSMCQGRLGPDVIRGRASSFAMPGHQEMNLSDPPERWPCKA
jgi:hypothetical protein